MVPAPDGGRPRSLATLPPAEGATFPGQAGFSMPVGRFVQPLAGDYEFFGGKSTRGLAPQKEGISPMIRSSSRRRIVRLALGLTALAVPLFGAGTAQAALGTSPQFAPQNRPYLTSVTDQGGTGLVNFCFGTSGGQAITAPAGGYDEDDFFITGYDESNDNDADTVAQLNNNCVQATFASAEIGEYSIGQVDANAAVAIIAGNPVGNLEDSAPLIGSSSNNGTRGFTTGLDLVNVLSPGSNRLAFVFDQDIDPQQLAAGCPGAGCITFDLMFYDGGGNLHQGGALISVSDNIAVVQYQNPPDAVSDARIGVVRHEATAGGNDLEADTPPGGNLWTSFGSAGVAGAPGSGNTANIEPTGAALVNGGNSNQVNFTFETNVAAGGASPACFTVTSANDNREFGDAISISGNTVTVTFNGIQLLTENLVRAAVTQPDAGPPCVQSTTGAVPNTMAGLPIGGNVGAVATGYTTGPEALGGITVSGGNVTVPVDARVDPTSVNFGSINLLDDQGNPIGGAPSNASVTGNGSPTDPHAVMFTFDPVSVAAASGMQWLDNAMSSFPGQDEVDDEDVEPQTFALP
jgi:hypothetical protein